jgi:hypothetical protein
VIAGLLALATVAILLVALYLRNRVRHSPPTTSTPEKFDTTLGDFHDMREALRPLEHTRTASRRDPNGGP